MFKPNTAGGNQCLISPHMDRSSASQILPKVMSFLLLFVFSTNVFSNDSIDSVENLASEECNPRVTINNNGPCVISIYHWLPTGDVPLGTIDPYSDNTFTAAEDGESYRVTSGRATATAYNVSYTVSGCNDQEFDAGSNYCNACTTDIIVNNNGSCSVCLAQWLPTGDVHLTRLHPGDTYTIRDAPEGATSVSYTHLTLPTTPYV